MTTTIQALLILLLAVATLAAARFYFVLGDVRRVLNRVDETREEMSGTLLRIESAADSTERAINEQLVPTLVVARDTLSHLEVTTRALADVTIIARRLGSRTEAVTDPGRLLSAGGALARTAAVKSFSLTGTLFSAGAAGLKRLFGHKKG